MLGVFNNSFLFCCLVFLWTGVPPRQQLTLGLARERRQVCLNDAHSDLPSHTIYRLDCVGLAWEDHSLCRTVRHPIRKRVASHVEKHRAGDFQLLRSEVAPPYTHGPNDALWPTVARSDWRNTLRWAICSFIHVNSEALRAPKAYF